VYVARTYCLGRPDILGFSHVPGVGVYLFNQRGYPLRDLPRATTFVKSTASAHIPPSVAVSAGLDVRYIPLGGSHHPDTRPFDDGCEVMEMAKVLANVQGVSGSLLKVVDAVRVGSLTVVNGNLVHGLQVGYTIGERGWNGGAHYGSEGAQMQTVKLPVSIYTAAKQKLDKSKHNSAPRASVEYHCQRRSACGFCMYRNNHRAQVRDTRVRFSV
jgi:hypothetical protein